MSNAAVELVEIRPSEKQEFWQVLQEYLRELDTLIGGNPLPGQTYEYLFWEEFWREPTGHTKLWIVTGGERTGFVLLRDVPAEEWPGTPLPIQIIEFYVFRPFRNRGIGSTVLNLLIDASRQRGEILTWDCLKPNPRAEKLYDRVVKERGRDADDGWVCRKAEFLAEAGPTYRYVCIPGPA